VIRMVKAKRSSLPPAQEPAPAPVVAQEPTLPWTQHPTGNQKAGTVPALPPRLTPAGSFMVAGSMALAQTKNLLEAEIDFKRPTDLGWLSDPENRRAAAIVLKLAVTQMNVALSLISNQLEAGAKWSSREAEAAERERVLGAMVQRLRQKP
jgi:hypothetical protein